MPRVVLPEDWANYCSWVSWANDCDNEELLYVAILSRASLEKDIQTIRLSCKL